MSQRFGFGFVFIVGALAASIVGCEGPVEMPDAGVDTSGTDGGVDDVGPIDGGGDDGGPIDGGGDDAGTDAPAAVTLTVSPTGDGTGNVTSTPVGISCGADCDMDVPPGTVVMLAAVPDAGSTFQGWSGGGCTGTGACMVTVTLDTTIDATFVADQTLTVALAGTGGGVVSSSPAGIDCGADCTEDYAAGTVVTLTATPTTGSTFAGWSGGGCTGTGTCMTTILAASTVMATFTLNTFDLTVARAGTGTGTVTSSPAGINCGADCTETYAFGTMVTLTAAPAVGSTFAGWSGGGCSGTGTCVTTVSAATTVTATFALNTFTLTVTRAGTGTGTVTSSPAGINCGADCAETYGFGTMVTLTAAPAPSSTFAGWSGGGCSGTGTCVTTVTAATAVTATFTVITLTVVRAGAVVGTVTSSPAGISCGADCTENYNSGTIVVLTATPAVGSSFAGWSGGGCTGTGTCVVTLTASTTVTATFNPTVYTTTSAWACGSGVSCEDVYDFTFPAGADITISVTGITGASVLRLGAFAPGVALSGANLLTGPSSDRMCGGQNVSDTVRFRAVTAGTYRIAVARDWGSSAGGSGNYSLSVASSSTLTFLSQTANDVASGATGTRCGFIFTVSTGWSCGAGVSCQDAFSFTTLAATTVTVAISAITGASVPRLAVFDGAAVTTTNRLNGMLTDRECVGQNVSDTATSAVLPTGAHLAAAGRDWGSSSGGSGTYTFTITTPNAPLVMGGQVNNDTASAFATTTCP